MNYINLILYIMGLALILIVFSATAWSVWWLIYEIADYFHMRRTIRDHDQEKVNT